MWLRNNDDGVELTDGVIVAAWLPRLPVVITILVTMYHNNISKLRNHGDDDAKLSRSQQ
jgi:hypothetical protein